MKKIFNFNYYSFSTKVIFSLFLFIVFFKLIKITLTTPKIENNFLNTEIDYITKTLLLTKEQIQIITKSLQMQSELEVDLFKKSIENDIKNFDLQINSSKKEKDIVNILEKSIIPKYCSYKISSNNINVKKVKGEDYFLKNNIKNLGKWQTTSINNKDKTFKEKNYLFYNYKLKNSNLLIELGCDYSSLNPNHSNFEKTLKD